MDNSSIKHLVYNPHNDGFLCIRETRSYYGYYWGDLNHSNNPLKVNDVNDEFWLIRSIILKQKDCQFDSCVFVPVGPDGVEFNKEILISDLVEDLLNEFGKPLTSMLNDV
jgi:hypothetical protein